MNGRRSEGRGETGMEGSDLGSEGAWAAGRVMTKCAREVVEDEGIDGEGGKERGTKE